MGESKYSSTHS